MTPEEMQEAGMVFNRRGHWTKNGDPKHLEALRGYE